MACVESALGRCGLGGGENASELQTGCWTQHDRIRKVLSNRFDSPTLSLTTTCLSKHEALSLGARIHRSRLRSLLSSFSFSTLIKIPNSHRECGSPPCYHSIFY